MNEALRQRLEWIAHREREEDVKAGYRITFTVCRICGFARWVGSVADGKGFSVAIGSDDEFSMEEDCPRCVTVFQRAPEVMKWVLAVIRHAAMAKQPEEKV